MATPTFLYDSRYVPNAGIDTIFFGADAPLLEVEMNELQYIINQKFERLSKAAFKSGVSPLTGVSFTGNNLEFKRGTLFLVNGIMIMVPASTDITFPLTANTTVYLEYWVEKKDYTATLTEEGYEEGSTVPNQMYDDRFEEETSRRKIMMYTFTTDPNPAREQLPIATIGNLGDPDNHALLVDEVKPSADADIDVDISPVQTRLITKRWEYAYNDNGVSSQTSPSIMIDPAFTKYILFAGVSSPNTFSARNEGLGYSWYLYGVDVIVWCSPSFGSDVALAIGSKIIRGYPVGHSSERLFTFYISPADYSSMNGATKVFSFTLRRYSTSVVNVEDYGVVKQLNVLCNHTGS